MAQEPRAQTVKVGIFLFVAIGLLVGLVFILGRQQSLFARKVHILTSFANSNGLVAGTPVRLAGVDVGVVEEISFDKDLHHKEVHVKLGINSRYINRIREDSIASLASKGLLGDMIVSISVGSADAAPLADGSTIKSQESQGLSEILSSVQEAIGNIKKLSAGLNETFKAVLTPTVAADVGRIVHSAANIAGEIEHGKGLVHSVLYDRRLAEDARGLIAHIDRVVSDVDHILGRIGKVNIEQIGANVSQVAKELADVIAEIKNGHGLVHTLVYEEDRTNLLQNLTALSKVLRSVGEDIEKGKGTLGALLKDPTLYEDLKLILGNIKRNKLLRALVRYTIRQDDLQAPETPKP